MHGVIYIDLAQVIDAKDTRPFPSPSASHVKEGKGSSTPDLQEFGLLVTAI